MLSPASFFSDFQQALRGLWRDKIFTVAVLTTFALCAGVNVVVFSVVHAVLLQPPGWPEPDQLVTITNHYSKFGDHAAAASVPNYYERRGGIAAFSEVAAMERSTALVGGGDSPARISSGVVTPSFFKLLGVEAALGRVFLEEESEGGRTNVAVLSDAWWREHYSADPTVIGRTVQLDGQPVTIVGVLPRDFHYFAERIELWRPLAFSAKDRDPNNRHWNILQLIARLRPGVSIAEAQAEVDAQNAHLAATDPQDAWAKASGFSTLVSGLHARHVASVRPALLLLEAGVWLLLLVGLVNVQNLLLVRASARAKEFAVRQVLGASGWAIASRFITETALLGLLGGAIGLGGATGALPVLSRLGLDRLELGAHVGVTAPVALLAVGVSLVLGVVLAVPLILFTRQTRMAAALAGESRSGTASRGRLRLRNALIVAQIGLAFVLLTCAALLGASFRNVLAVDPGFRPRHVAGAWIGLTPKRYRASAERFRFSGRWLHAVRALPGVESAAVSTSVPLTKGIWFQTLMVEGHTPREGEQGRPHDVIGVMGDYFSTLGVPLREGRYLTDADSAVSRKVCVVDEAFARRYWPNESALNHRVATPGKDDPLGDDGMTIVGVVGTVKQNGLTETTPAGTLYFPFRSEGFTPDWLATSVRTAQSPEGVVPAMRSALQRLDPDLPLGGVTTMEAWVDDSSRTERSLMLLSSSFAGMALLLAAVGVYGVMAYTVAQKQKEVGIRMALGALPSHILRQFLGLGGRLLLPGAVVGVLGAWFAAGALHGLLFQISPTTPAVFVLTALALGVIVMLACVIPSRRAAAISMMESLKHE